MNKLEVPQYREVLSEITKSYMGKDELEKFTIYSEVDFNINQISITLFGKHDIRARGILDMDDVVILPPDQFTSRLSYFVKEVYDAYIAERIKRGFVPLKTLNSKKGVFE